MNGAHGPMEPSADMRALASNVRQIYVALVAEGFSEEQALEIVGHILKSGGKQ